MSEERQSRNKGPTNSHTNGSAQSPESEETEQSVEPQSDSGLLQSASIYTGGLLTGVAATLAAHTWMKSNRTRFVVDGERGVMEFQEPSQIYGSADPGQLLEFDRPEGYAHFALYLGNGMVMNIKNNLVQGILKGEARIQEATLKEVCERDRVRIRNHDDLAFQKYRVEPNPRDEILEFAYLMKDQTVHYDVLGTNCEYYATLWRYGVGFSAQVNYFPPK